MILWNSINKSRSIFFSFFIKTVSLFSSPAGVCRFGCDHVRDGDRVPAALGARHFRSLQREEMVFDSGKNVKPSCSAGFYWNETVFWCAAPGLWAVCSRDGSSQPNHNYPNGSELPEPPWGITLLFSLCSRVDRCSKCVISSILETRCPWGIQAAFHDATEWNQQGQQDAALQYSERGKGGWFCFFVDFNCVSALIPT